MKSGNHVSPEIRALARRQADYCKVFGSATRILIIWSLQDQERCVSEIAERIASSLQNTSQHLRLMEDKGILVSRRAGNLIYYAINTHSLPASCPLVLTAQPNQPASEDLARHTSTASEKE